MDSVNCRLTSHGLISNGSSTNINVTNANNNSNTITSNNLNSTNNINLNNNLNNANANNNHQNMNGGPNNNLPVADIRQQYTMAGIVQFLQYEWQRFELHRQQWEVMLRSFCFESSNLKYLHSRLKNLNYKLE